MATHNQEGRGRTPEKHPILNQLGVDQYYAATQRNHLGTQLLINSENQQYPERVRDLVAAPNVAAGTMAGMAAQQAMDMRVRMGQEATQGAYAQTPGTWVPTEQVPVDAPQGYFTPEEIDAARSHPQPGFEPMYVPVDQHTRQTEVQQDAASRFEDFVLGQEAVNQWENPS